MNLKVGLCDRGSRIHYSLVVNVPTVQSNPLKHIFVICESCCVTGECVTELYTSSDHGYSVCVCVLFYGQPSGVNLSPFFLTLFSTPLITACKTQLVSLARIAVPMKHTTVRTHSYGAPLPLWLMALVCISIRQS